MGRQHTSLWRHRDFLKLLTGGTISLMGSQITLLALPLTAALALHASVFQVGLLSAAAVLPGLVLGPVTGVWADRRRRRPLLIGGAIGSAVVLGSIPLAALAHRLSLWQIYAVAALIGALGTTGAATRPYISTLVSPEQVVESNSMLEVSNAVAQISGPGLGGVLVQALSAPLAIGLDALSFLVSALCLGAIRTPELSPVRAGQRRNMRAELAEGLRLILENPYLRTIAATTGTAIFFQAIVAAVYVYYMARSLALPPTVQGAVFAAGGLGTLLGAFVATRITRRFGVGPTIVGTELLVGLAALLIPLSAVLRSEAAAVLIAAQCLQGIAVVIYDINWLSLLQVVTPHRLQGQVNASFGVLIFGLQPVGAALGGALGTLIGLPLTLLLAGLGWSLAFLWPLCSPIRALRAMPIAAARSQDIDHEEEVPHA